MALSVPATIQDCPVALTSAGSALSLPYDLGRVWAARDRVRDVIDLWPARPTSDGEPVDYADLTSPQIDALTGWVTDTRRQIAVAYGFKDAHDLASFEGGMYGLATDVVVHDPLTVGGMPDGPARSDWNRLARRSEALAGAWSLVRDYAPGAPGAVKAAALSRLARFLSDTSPGIENEQATGSYAVAGESGVSQSRQRSVAYARSDRPLHQSGAASILSRWRTFRAGAVG